MDDEKERLLEIVGDDDEYATRHRFVYNFGKYLLNYILFRVIIIGGGGVGKTALIEKFLAPENYQFYESVYGNYHLIKSNRKT